MEDIYEYDQDNVFCNVFGRSKYVTGNRDIDNDLFNAVLLAVNPDVDIDNYHDRK